MDAYIRFCINPGQLYQQIQPQNSREFDEDITQYTQCSVNVARRKKKRALPSRFLFGCLGKSKMISDDLISYPLDVLEKDLLQFTLGLKLLVNSNVSSHVVSDFSILIRYSSEPTVNPPSESRARQQLDISFITNILKNTIAGVAKSNPTLDDREALLDAVNVLGTVLSSYPKPFGAAIVIPIDSCLAIIVSK